MKMTNFEYMASSPERMAEKIIEIKNGISGAGKEVLDIMYSGEYSYTEAVKKWLKEEQCLTDTKTQ